MLKKNFKITTAILSVTLCLAGCGGTPQEKEARYLKKGNELFDHKDYGKAKIEYMNAARVVPTDPEAMYRIGLTYDAQGDFKDAFGFFTRAEEQNRHFHPALLKLAEYYLAAGQFAGANDRISLILAEDPQNAQADALMSARYFREKQYDEALQQANKALKIDPKNVLAIGMVSGVYRVQGDQDKALQTLKDGIAQNPENETLLHLLAVQYEQTDQVDMAAQTYETLFKVVPDDTLYRLELAGDYIKVKKFDEAEAVLRQAIKKHPDNLELQHQLVLFLAEYRSVDVAEKEVRQEIAQNPDKAEPLNWLINIYLTHKMADKTGPLLDEIIAQATNDEVRVHAQTAKARLLYANKDKPDAEQLVKTILAKDPNNIDAQFVRAHIEADDGNLSQAAIDLRNIIRDKPDASEAYDMLSEILLQQGHRDLAIDTLNQLSEKGALKTPEQVRLAQLYVMNGDTKHAMDLLTTATKSDPTYSVAWETVARITLGLKDYPAADAAIETLDGLKDQHLTAVLLRGEEAMQQGKTEDAIARYKDVINADADAPQAHYALPSLISAYQARGKLEDAAQYLSTLQPPTPMVDMYLGECYLALGQLDKATDALDRALAAGIRDQTPYLDRARIDLRAKNIDHAIEILTKGSAANPSDMRAPIAEAELLERAGKTDAAIALYDKLLTQHPDSDLIANNFAELIADHAYNDPTKLEHAQQIAERFTGAKAPALLDTLAWVYYRQNRNQDALIILDRVARSDEAIPAQLHYHYGMALIKADRTDQARIELQKATAEGLDYPGIDDARTALKSLPTPK